jgi:DNA primase
VLFNLDKAKQEIKKQDLAVIVEGQMDAISVFEAGTQNVIASSGTALTEDQVRILKRYTNNLAMSFDMDAAGENAAKRGIDIALANEMNVRLIVLPSGKDPDECIKNDPNQWFEAVKNAQTIMEYYFDKTFSKHDITKAEGKKMAAKILLPVIVRLSNKIEQTHWLQKLADNLNVTEQVLRNALPGGQKNYAKSQPAPVLATKPVADRKNLIDQRLLGIVLKYPSFLSFLIDNLPQEVIIDLELNQLYKKLILYYTENINGDSQSFNYEEFRNLLKNDELDQLADKLVLLTEKDFFDFDQDIMKAELSVAIINGKRDYYNNYLKDLQGKIKEAESLKQDDVLPGLLNEFNKIVELINSLE